MCSSGKMVETRVMINIRKGKSQSKSADIKLIVPEQGDNGKVLGPAHLVPSRSKLANDTPLKDPSSSPSRSSTKRKRTDLTELGDRSPKITRPPDEELTTVEIPKTDSLVHILVQGLQSNSKSMLDSVLQRGDPALILNTVNKLPVTYIQPLLNVLQQVLYYKGHQNHIYIKWLLQLFQSRLSFILNLPNLENILGPLMELLNARTDILNRMYQLQGRLHLIAAQMNKQNTQNSMNKQNPYMVYEETSSEDESSDEADDNNEMLDLIHDPQSDDENDEKSEDRNTDHDSSEEEKDVTESEAETEMQFNTDTEQSENK